MSRILLAWELGGGTGALSRLNAIASVLASEGHEPVFVVRNLVECSRFLRRQGFAAFPAPDWRSAMIGRIRASEVAGYADILVSSGFSEAARIAAILAAWDTLIDYLRPDAAIADGSPALMLAARGRFPVVAVGDGFALPPDETAEFPALLPGVPPVLPQPQLLNMINEVLAARGAAALARLPDMLRAEAGFVLGLAVLDPYAALRRRSAVGPIEPLPRAARRAAGRSVYAALDASFPAVPNLMAGFARSDLPTLVYLRGATLETKRRFGSRNVRIVEAPPAGAIDDASVVVHHGSADGTTHALAAGRPQIIVPTGLESHLTGQIVRRLRVGDIFPIKETADHVGGALLALAGDRDSAARAAALADDLERPEPGEVLGRIVDRCRDLLGPVAA